MDWAIKIGYAVMVFAIIMCFIFSKRGEKEMRHMVDRFAQAFCKLSNYVLPGGKAPAASLSTRKKDGVMQALPAAEQPEELQKLMKRGTARHLAELYGQMEEASAERGPKVFLRTAWCTAAAATAATGSFSPIPSGRSAT